MHPLVLLWGDVAQRRRCFDRLDTATDPIRTADPAFVLLLRDRLGLSPSA